MTAAPTVLPAAALSSPVFARRGGVALGLHLAGLATAGDPSVRVPQWRVTGSDLDPAALVRHVHDAAHAFGTGVALRWSGMREAFTEHARRGVNSTGVRFTSAALSAGEFDERRAAAVLARAPQGTVAVVLQALVALPDAVGPLHCYAEATGVTVELTRPAHGVRLVHRSADGAVRDEWLGAPPMPDEQAAVEQATTLVADLRASLGFDVDLEGYWSRGVVTVLQLRPVPQDLPTDPALTPVVAELAGGAEHRTGFVWGAFDVRATVLDAPGPPPDAHAGAAGSLLLVDADARRPGWERLLLGRPGLVLLDTDRGFHLSHAHDLLPPAGRLRSTFRYLSVAGRPGHADLVGRTVRCVSDGITGVVTTR